MNRWTTFLLGILLASMVLFVAACIGGHLTLTRLAGVLILASAACAAVSLDIHKASIKGEKK